MSNSKSKEDILELVGSIGGIIIYLSGFIVVIFTIIYLFQGNLVEKAVSFLLILNTINSYLFYLLLFILLPLAIFKKTRPFSGLIMALASYLFGVALWIYSAIITYLLWGWIAVFIGIFLAGVGVLPVAILATIFHGDWSVFGNLIFGTVLTFGSRFLGIYLIEKADQEKYIDEIMERRKIRELKEKKYAVYKKYLPAIKALIGRLEQKNENNLNI